MKFCRNIRSFAQIKFAAFGQTFVNGARNRADIVTEELKANLDSIEVDSPSYVSFIDRFGDSLSRARARIDVLFIDGTYGSGLISMRYRILNIADGLRDLGYTSLYAHVDKANVKNLSKLSPRVVVFYRATLDGAYRPLLDAFRAKGSRIIFDVDDLVFDETIVSGIDSFRHLSVANQGTYLQGVRHYRAFALEADLVTAATDFLAEYARKDLGRNSVRIRNTIGRRYMNAYSDERVRYDRDSQDFVVGYYSGSMTHQADFQQAYPALVQFLRTYETAIFRLVGMFDLDEFEDLKPFGTRILAVPMLSYGEMIEDLGKCDVIIAPLVPGDPFCESKSELKFFEAALRTRCCIASPTATFVTATDQGRYAYIADTAKEWFGALSELYNSKQRRLDLAMAAKSHVIRAFSYKVAGTEAERAYFGVLPPRT